MVAAVLVVKESAFHAGATIVKGEMTLFHCTQLTISVLYFCVCVSVLLKAKISSNFE